MTRKHFVQTAAIVRQEIDKAEQFDNAFGDGRRHTAIRIAAELADYFAEENPNFDRDRFMFAATGKAL